MKKSDKELLMMALPFIGAIVGFVIGIAVNEFFVQQPIHQLTGEHGEINMLPPIAGLMFGGVIGIICDALICLFNKKN